MSKNTESVQNIQEAKKKWPEKQIGKAQDLTNKRFGKLVCLYRTNNIRNLTVWVCQCDCGNIKPIRANEITQTKKSQKSCGCEAHKRAKNFGKITFKDITGQRFGKLIAIEKSNQNSHGYTYWKCKCDCGNECLKLSRDLLNGDTLSCGCLSAEKESFWENYISNKLKSLNINFKQEYKFDDLKDIFQLRFDFAILENDQIKGLIEFQGSQHYDKNNPFYNISIVKHDQMKKDYCKQNNIPLFEIKYTEIDNIDNKLKEILKDLRCYPGGA